MDRPIESPPVDEERRELLALAPRLLLAAPLSPMAAMLLLPSQRAAAQAAGAASGVFSQPEEPQLRIEAGMHTAMINRIDTDAAGRYAVTASEDKTARVWDISSGALLQVLRPPIGPGNEGKLFAAAMSSDGSTVAVAGWTERGSNGGHTVYLFDRASGQLQRRLGGLPNVILHLSFSLDGRWLAATLGGPNGVRVWDWRRQATAQADSSYGNDSYGAAWSIDGRLATTSDDGKLRLYRPGDDGRLAKLAEAAATGGKEPFALAFHPDGSRIAVGYYDSTGVDVLDSQRLLPLFAVSTQGVDNGDLRTVAWSRDGLTLVAAGRWSRGRRMSARIWTDAGRGQPRDVPLGNNTVMHLAALPAGGWVVAALDPAWGLLGAQGAWEPLGRPPIADLRNSVRDAFLLAGAGRRLQFGYEPFGKPPHQFDVSRRALSAGLLTGGQAPDTTAVPVLNWQTDPTFRGEPIRLEQNEGSRSLAAVPGDRGFVLGTEFRLRHYAADGTLHWQQPAPEVVWGVNIPTDGPQAGQIVVAAYGDGTIRWHRMSDGSELLAFFPHADRQRWVLWTPSGYYDASPGGEDLIGWHVNRLVQRGATVVQAFADRPAQRAGLRRGDIVLTVGGTPISDIQGLIDRTKAWPGGAPLRLRVERNGQSMDIDVTPDVDSKDRVPRIGVELGPALGHVEASDFFSVSRFRDRFNRPDVIDRVLDTLDEAEAVRLADMASKRVPLRAPLSASLPPAVDVLTGLDLTTSTPRLRLQVRARSAPDAPVTGWRVRVNGTLAGDSGSLAASVAPSPTSAATAAFTGRPDEPDIVLTLPPADAEVELFAQNRFGISEPATVRVKWTGPIPARPAAGSTRGRLLVLAVGVSEYQNPGVRRLNLAAKDARDFVAALKRQQGRQYHQVQERLLPDREATREAVMDGMTWLQNNAGPQDLAVMFVAGHGMNDGARGYSFLPVDADPARLFSTGVPASAIRTVLGGMKGRALFFFDTCHSGGVLAAPAPGGPKPHELQDVNTVINDLSSAENGVTVYSSSGSRQLSLESTEWNNGAFTRAVVEGLNGEAVSTRNPDRITRQSLALYLSDRVVELTGGRQTPQSGLSGADFIIALK